MEKSETNGKNGIMGYVPMRITLRVTEQRKELLLVGNSAFDRGILIALFCYTYRKARGNTVHIFIFPFGGIDVIMKTHM